MTGTHTSQHQHTTRPVRLGVMGGTFDPIHIGHLAIAEEARVRLALDEVLFVPARVSPLKLGNTCASGEDRYRMVSLAIADNAHFAISRIELDREGPSYTVDTLEALHTACGRVELYFILGMDSLETLVHWRRPDAIVRLARLVVVTRPGYVPDWPALERAIPGVTQASEVIDTVRLDISSTELRERVRAGMPIRYLVPASVEAYIYDHQLYRDERTRASAPSC
jgi:nicotinate-nucleotide adenylyltransferase